MKRNYVELAVWVGHSVVPGGFAGTRPSKPKSENSTRNECWTAISKTQEEKDADEAEKSTPILKKELASVDTKVKEYTNLVNDHTGKTVVVNKLEDSKKSANDLVTQGITLKQTAVDLRRKAEDKLFLAEIAETAAPKRQQTRRAQQPQATEKLLEVQNADLLSANKDEVVQKIDKDAIDLDEKIKQLVKDAEKTHTEAKEAEKLAQNSVVTTKAEAEAAFLKSVNAEKEARKLFRLAEDLNSHINVIKVAADNAKTDPAIGTKADASVKRVAASIVEIEPVLKESDKTTLPNLLNALEAAKNGKLEAHKRIALF
uniref:Uncharacterized protein n=1 Tax=Ditylenchus dipsaci TaxID=166011 RepID=A0A915E2T4_9BILA